MGESSSNATIQGAPDELLSVRCKRRHEILKSQTTAQAKKYAHTLSALNSSAARPSVKGVKQSVSLSPPPLVAPFLVAGTCDWVCDCTADGKLLSWNRL